MIPISKYEASTLKKAKPNIIMHHGSKFWFYSVLQEEVFKRGNYMFYSWTAIGLPNHLCA